MSCVCSDNIQVANDVETRGFGVGRGCLITCCFPLVLDPSFLLILMPLLAVSIGLLGGTIGVSLSQHIGSDASRVVGLFVAGITLLVSTISYIVLSSMLHWREIGIGHKVSEWGPEGIIFALAFIIIVLAGSYLLLKVWRKQA